MQSIGASGLDAANSFLGQAPECHLMITPSSLSIPSPLAADGTTLYTSTEAVEQALPTAREALYKELCACYPETLPEDEKELIRKEVEDTLHVVYIGVVQQYRMPPVIHQVLKHTHDSGDPSDLGTVL